MAPSRKPLLKRLQYIWDYYKVPLAASGIILYILIYVIFRFAAGHSTVLYAAAVNVKAENEAIELFAGAPDFLTEKKSSGDRAELAENLFLVSDPDSEYHEYVYASRLKILASIEAGKLDLVIADRQAMEAFSGQGFLLPLEEIFRDDKEIRKYLRSNDVILEDNHLDVLFDESVPYEASTRSDCNAVEITSFPFFSCASESSGVYLGIIANTKRQSEAVKFIRFLFDSAESIP